MHAGVLRCAAALATAALLASAPARCADDGRLEKEGDLWMTRQVHQNIIAVASLKDHAGIILVHGAEPAKDTLEKALKENIPLLGTDLSGFEIAGRIFNIIRGKKEIAAQNP